MTKKTWLSCLILIAGVSLGMGAVQAQNLEDKVSQYTEENAKGYLQPFADALGAAMNSGLYHNAKISRLGFHFYLGLETMTALITEPQKSFSAKIYSGGASPTSIQAPTIFGSTEEVPVPGPGGTGDHFPGGMNLSMLPIAVPQLVLGSFAGTDLTLRWMEFELPEDIGRLKVSGWGIRHSLSQYLLLSPLDIAIGYYSQNFKIGDIVDAKASLVGLQGSVSGKVFVLYGGMGLESSSLNIAYTSEANEKIAFNLKGKNKTRVTLGMGMHFSGMLLHVDYNMGSQNVVALGIGIGN